MKYALFALLIATTACSHQPARQESPARQLASAGSVYLNTESAPSAAQTLLLAAATGRQKLSGQETTAAINAYGISEELQTTLKHYAGDLYASLGIDPERSQEWIEKHAELYKGISNYVGSSDESMADEEISWQSINIQLRGGKKMSGEEKKYLGEILHSLSRLPVATGLAFRGVRMTKEHYNAIPSKGPWPQPAFTSTSLDPQVAQGFGSGHEGYSQTGILVLKLKKGYPVSPLTFDHGRMGQPGRFQEYELLLPPGRTLLVHAKVEDSETKTYYVFAEEK